nr:MAG TPA: hypothetical protein [Caudoviricetes sp.]
MKLKKFLTKIYKGNYIELIKDGKCMGSGIPSVFAEVMNKEILNMQIKEIKPVNEVAVEIFIGEKNG